MSETVPPGPGGLPLEEYDDHRSMIGPGQVLWENNGWSLRGVAGGREMLLWTSPYLLHGSPGSAFRLGDASVTQTMLIFADDPERPLEEPNDFVSVGWEPDQFGDWSDWTVNRDDARARWSGPGREVTAWQDHWELVGDHAGVGLEVRLDPITAVQWLSPPEEPLGKREDRWWIANASASGRLRWAGEDLELESHGLHERHIHLGTGYNPVSLLRGQGVTWHSGHQDDVSYSVLARPDRDLYWAQVVVGERVWDIRQSDAVRVTAVEHWDDPDTWLRLPKRWELEVVGEGLSLRITALAHARAYYVWDFLRDGVTVLYWWLCTSEGQIESGEGSRRLQHVRSEVHLNKTIYERRDRRTLHDGR